MVCHEAKEIAQAWGGCLDTALLSLLSGGSSSRHWYLGFKLLLCRGVCRPKLGVCTPFHIPRGAPQQTMREGGGITRGAMPCRVVGCLSVYLGGGGSSQAARPWA